MPANYSMQRFSPAGGMRGEHLRVVWAVALFHVAVFALGSMQSGQPSVAVNEMAVSFAQRQSVQTRIVMPSRKPEPVRQAVASESRPAADMPRVVQPTPGVAPNTPLMEDSKLAADASSAAPVVLDAPPDYQADYLHNPRPMYPKAARRMGFQGRVVLNVEVLAAGSAGQVLLQVSSGHDILDNAALQTVKTWRFSPARRLGRAVTEWFLVPVNFSLEDENA